MKSTSSPAGIGKRVAGPKTRSGVFADLKEFLRFTKEDCGLLPISAVSTVLGVSRQRVHQLVTEGTFTMFKFYGFRWLLEKEVVSFAKLHRRPSDSQFQPFAKQIWKAEHGIGKGSVKHRRVHGRS